MAESRYIGTDSFGVEDVTLVGDQGMLEQAEINLLNQERFHYITAITKPQIRKLLREGVFQMGLFEEKSRQVGMARDVVRYILRRNPERAKELASNRGAKRCPELAEGLTRVPIHRDWARRMSTWLSTVVPEWK